ncbi:hypothetical protein [Emticicia oligotrophica]|uniref:hypothetical protein n=1 Tax=Emticicia oligotrophica TaxID=312279 RepID=UPI00273AB6DC|nr:hypothetical protein [Emticicia oligotrophica]
MEKVISLLKEPIFWFATVLVSIITSVFGNYVFGFLEKLRTKYNEKIREKSFLEDRKMYEKAISLSKSKEDLILKSIELNTIYFEIVIQFLWIFAGLGLAGFLYINFEKFNSWMFFSMITFVLFDLYKSSLLYKKLINSKEILIMTKILMDRAAKENDKNVT